ncbi:MAG: hypothetical protein GY861_01195 [bacterium]|nr:hypothetical protein [bacterium]
MNKIKILRCEKCGYEEDIPLRTKKFKYGDCPQCGSTFAVARIISSINNHVFLNGSLTEVEFYTKGKED